MAYRSSKVLGPYSACFRNWRANSHCNLLHGYGLTFTLTFEANELDHRGWVIDFGGFEWIKKMLADRFDHKLLMAEDDPDLGLAKAMEARQLASLFVVPAIGCEAFAVQVAKRVHEWLEHGSHASRVRLVQVECREHANNAGYWVGG